MRKSKSFSFPIFPANDFRFMSWVSLDSGLSWPPVGPKSQLPSISTNSTYKENNFQHPFMAEERRAARGWTPIKVVPDKITSLSSYHSKDGKESVKVFKDLEI